VNEAISLENGGVFNNNGRAITIFREGELVVRFPYEVLNHPRAHEFLAFFLASVEFEHLTLNTLDEDVLLMARRYLESKERA